jgi:hypothetical protein
MSTSRRDFLKKGSLIAVAAAVPTSVVRGLSSRELVAPLGAESVLNKAAFTAQLNTQFRIKHARSQVMVKLVDVSDLKHRKGARKGKEGFSLLFREPNVASLAQGTYEIQHDKLGAFSFLLVPVPSKGKVISYEAVVNRLYP